MREGKLTPVSDGAAPHKRSITYHDPCYIGRHNGVYSPPRELLEVLPGAEFVEMERNSERSFCCGAGGARMWMEENIGERINVNRTNEAVGTGADQIAVGCPFCRVMLSDGLTAAQADGKAREEVEVLDVAQMLLASVKGEVATRRRPGEAAPPLPRPRSGPTKAEPEAGDVTQTEDTVTDTEDVGPAAKASGGSSLFDTPAEDEPSEEAREAREAVRRRVAVRRRRRRRARGQGRARDRSPALRRVPVRRRRRRAEAGGQARARAGEEGRAGPGQRRLPLRHRRPSRAGAKAEPEPEAGARARAEGRGRARDPSRRIPLRHRASGASVSEAATQAASDDRV